MCGNSWSHGNSHETGWPPKPAHERHHLPRLESRLAALVSSSTFGSWCSAQSDWSSVRHWRRSQGRQLLDYFYFHFLFSFSLLNQQCFQYVWQDIQVINKLGGTVDDTELVDGLVLDQRSAGGTGPTRVEKAKIALIQFCISPPKTDVRFLSVFNSTWKRIW